jgi:hypothetical protein
MWMAAIANLLSAAFVELLVSLANKAWGANCGEDQVSIPNVGDPLGAAGRDTDQIAGGDDFRLQTFDLDATAAFEDEVSLRDTAEPMPSCGDARGHPCPGDGDGGIVCAVPGF